MGDSTRKDRPSFFVVGPAAQQPAQGGADVEALLQQTNLWDVRKKNLGTYSGGMKQRFGIAQALLGNPKLIIVDEPTAGLDPSERNRFLNLLGSIGDQVKGLLRNVMPVDQHLGTTGAGVQ